MNRRHRLRGRAAFLALRGSRASATSRSLRVGMVANGKDVARVGFAIPRSSGGSVVRNRMRRRLREAIRPQLTDLSGVDVVIGVRPEAATRSWDELCGDLKLCLAQAGQRLPRTGGSPAMRPPRS